MAIEYGDGKAGQYAKSQAQKKFERITMILIIAVAGGSVLLGMVSGFSINHALAAHFEWARRSSTLTFFWIALACEAVLAGAAVVSIRTLRAPLGEIARERVKWLHGGQAEALVAWSLRTLNDDWHVFNNVMLGNRGDLDHVVIGPGGVFCLSTKSGKGTIDLAADDSYLLNGEPTDHLKEAQKLALDLRHQLEVRLPDAGILDIPFVQPVLVMPFAYIEFPPFQQTAWVLDDYRLVEKLADGPKTLNAKTVDATVAVLKKITKREARL